MHFWHNYHRSDALHFSLHPFRGTWFQYILLPIMFILIPWLRFSTVRSLFFPLILLFWGLLSHLAWTPTPYTRPLMYGHLHHPGMDNLLTPFRLWHPILGHPVCGCPAHPTWVLTSMPSLCSAQTSSLILLWLCLCFMEALVIHLGSNTVWQVSPVAGHPPFGLRHPMLGPPPPQTPAHTS